MGTRCAASTLIAAVALLVAAAPAGAKTSWLVKGAGFGHGVGMSAYGAYGYGKHDWAYKRILGHYFRRTTVKRMRRTPQVRVLLETDAGDVRFTNAKRACGKALRPSRSYLAHRNGSNVRLMSKGGKALTSCGERLRAQGRGTIKIGGVGRYRGELSVIPTGSGSLNAINVLGVDSYVQGVIPVELFPSWPKETLRAFAVAMRSIALTTDVGGEGFDLYPDTRTQVYGGAGVETKRTNRAVRATRGEVVAYRGKPIQATYFSASGGRTESGFLGAPDVPWLQSVKDPYDDLSPLHRWRFRFSQAEMNAKLGPYVKGRLKRIVVTKRGDSPRIDRAKLIGSGGAASVRGDTLQAALGLYDRWAYFKKVGRGSRSRRPRASCRLPARRASASASAPSCPRG